MAHLLVLQTFNIRAEAEVARGVLAAEHIKTVVIADDAGGMYPHLMWSGGVRLMVHERDFSKAKDILTDYEAGEPA